MGGPAYPRWANVYASMNLTATNEHPHGTLCKEHENHTALLVHVYRLFFPLFLAGVVAVADDKAPSPEPSANIDVMLLGFRELAPSRGFN